mmetsp:Transcript_12943/g.17782  ORF Transcript_12943/g.17782 Transcript_12943/m.17782 type:complete len:139 (-) Transcript_12943:48-464(-)
MLPEGNPIINVLLALYCVNLVIATALVGYSGHLIIERYFIPSRDLSSGFRKKLENFSRLVLVTLFVLVALVLGKKLGNFLSVMGALAMTPISFTIPTLLHYYVCAETPAEKRNDIIVILISIVITIFCTYWALINWDG